MRDIGNTGTIRHVKVLSPHNQRTVMTACICPRLGMSFSGRIGVGLFVHAESHSPVIYAPPIDSVMAQARPQTNL